MGGGKRRDLEIFEEDADFFFPEKSDAEYEFFDRELAYSSKKGKKSKKGSKKGKGGKRRDLESIEDIDMFVPDADIDAEYLFFDRELGYSSKKSKKSKKGKKGKGKGGKRQ